MSNDFDITSLAFLGNSPLLIADEQRVIVKVNKACEALTGFATNIMLDYPLDHFYTPSINRYIHEADECFLALLSKPGERESVSGKTVRENKQGEIIHFIETITVVRDDTGNAKYFVVYFQDVTSLENTQEALVESQQTYSSLIESMHDGVVMLDQNKVIDCNEQFARMLLRDKADIVGTSVAQFSTPMQPDGANSGEKAAQVFRSVLGGRPGWVEWSMLRSNGQPVDMEVSLSPATMAGKPIMLATLRDITARKKIERERQELLDELAEKEELTRLAGRASGVVSWLLNVKSGAVSWSDGAEESLGFRSGELGKTLDEIKALMQPDQLLVFESELEKALTTGEAIRFESPRRGGRDDDDRDLRWFSTFGQVEFDARGEATIIRGSVSDITDQKNAQREIERLAYYDPLTSLANRRLLLDRLRQCCAQAVRRGTSGAVLFIDLDKFKLLNDSLGHQAGDDLLREVAARLQRSLRNEDTVARLGGDEFVVLLPAIDGDARQVAGRVQRIADLLRNRLGEAYTVNNHDYHMSASIGAAIFPQDSDRADEVLQHADAAMYLAKKSGRNTSAFYHAELQEAADLRLTMEQDLRAAIQQGQLEVHYQPKVDINNHGAIVGVEALVRWQHPERGMIMPGAFIPVAEETGFIISLGRWVLEQACDQVMRWNEKRTGPSLGLAVNVSPIQFRHVSFVRDVRSVIDRKGIFPELLTLEITEGTLIDNMSDTRTKLDELQQLGVRMSIDDFGTGYSSLYYLKNLPLNEIKIDRAYIQDILDDSSDAAIVASIMAIAKNLGLAAVAEGVETAAQAEFLSMIDCHIHQGYLYARPLSVSQFEESYMRGKALAD